MPSGCLAFLAVRTEDSRNDGRPVVGDWAQDEASTGLVTFKNLCIDFDRPHWVRIAKVALDYKQGQSLRLGETLILSFQAPHCNTSSALWRCVTFELILTHCCWIVFNVRKDKLSNELHCLQLVVSSATNCMF